MKIFCALSILISITITACQETRNESSTDVNTRYDMKVCYRGCFNERKAAPAHDADTASKNQTVIVV
jgi:hypothetical protein